MNEGVKKLGELFKTKRKELNLSLKEVENATSIRTSHLESIEEGKDDAFLSPVFMLGFMRQYASFLGVDGEKLISEHPEALKLGKKNTNNPSVLEISYNYRPSWVFAGTHNLGFVYFTNRYSYCDEFVAKEKAAPIVEKAKEKPKKPAKPKIKYITKYDTIIKYAPAKVNTAAEFKKVNEILKGFASNIEFRTATAILTDRGEGALMVIGNLIKKYPRSTFLIEGHTDSDGNPANNMRLSKLRAKTVARYLTEFKNIPSKNMKVKWPRFAQAIRIATLMRSLRCPTI